MGQCLVLGMSQPEKGQTVRAWDYPFDIVRLKCKVCGRYGQYPKERFIELVGASTSLPEARYIIAKDCPREKSGLAMHNRCGVSYPDLSEVKNKT